MISSVSASPILILPPSVKSPVIFPLPSICSAEPLIVEPLTSADTPVEPLVKVTPAFVAFIVDMTSPSEVTNLIELVDTNNSFQGLVVLPKSYSLAAWGTILALALTA